MKAIILNAGIGKRLAPITNTTPKCLIKINENETILDYQIKSIMKCEISDFLILTGPFEDQIKTHIKTKFPSINVEYINNPLHKTTNYIYSIYLAKDSINSDIIYSHGDLLDFPF